MATSRIAIRTDTAAGWASTDPTLAAGEQGHETDTGRRKIGDGTTAWNALLYSNHVAPGLYERSRRFMMLNNVAGRNTIVLPDNLAMDVGGKLLPLNVEVTIDADVAGSWDSATYATKANRAGKDFYIYACAPATGAVPVFKLSANSTFPSGYTASDSRKIGQFHCLCADVGSNVYPYVNEGKDEDYFGGVFASASLSNGDTKHWIEGFSAGDILPFSVQDLLHRPHNGADREGRTYDPSKNRWVMIYLPSWDASAKRLVSFNGGTIADGASSPAFHQYRFQQVLGRQGEMLADQGEFVSFSLGSPQGVELSSGSDPVTTGGHLATNGQRIISLIGVEDATGVLWQWGRESWAGGTASYQTATDANDKNVAGQHYLAPNRPLFSGVWGDGEICGSRGAYWSNVALYLHSSIGARGVAEPY